MAEHPLSDSYLLVERAKTDLQTLATQIETFLRREPYRLIIKPNRQAARNDVVADFTEQPSPQWKIDFGVTAGHLRSALDYIPAYLANPEDPGESRTQFPIFFSKSDYLTPDKRGRTARDKMLVGVPPAHKHLFDKQQPYARGDDPETGPLGIISRATRLHKHRKLHTQVIAIENATVTVVEDDRPTVEVSIAGMNLNASDHLFGFTTTAKHSVRLEYKLATYVAFGDPRITPLHLGQSIVRVEEILESFEPVLSPGIG